MGHPNSSITFGIPAISGGGKYKSRTPFGEGALGAGVTNTATAPSGSAVGNGEAGTITIHSGGGFTFGTNTNLTPHFVQPFTSVSNGATPLQAGFDYWSNRGGEAVTLADGIGSGGSLRCDPGAAGNAFPHIGKYLPSNTLEMRLSFHVRLYGSSAVDRQLKFVRAGLHTGGGDALDDYNTAPVFKPSLYIGGNRVLSGNSIQATWKNSSGTETTRYTEDSGDGSSGIPIGSQQDTDFTDWVHGQTYYKFNDVGSANGIYRIWLNQWMAHNRTAVQPRLDAGDSMGFVQLLPSLDLDGSPTDMDYAMARIFIYTGPGCIAEVFLSNQSTLAAVGRNRYDVKANSWANDDIVADPLGTIPSGYIYAYVRTTAGAINTNGLTYTVNG